MLVTFDTETTCTSKVGIVELACHITVGGEEYHMVERCNPGFPITPGASNIHGIWDHDIADCRTSQEVVSEWWNEVMSLLNDHPQETLVLAGHNVPFDLRAVRKLIDIPYEIPILDTLRLARQRYPNFTNHKLGTVHTSLGLNTNKFNLHEALSDVLIVVEIIQFICAQEGVGYLQLAEEQKKPMPLKQMPFGKHKGVKFTELDAGYMNYMLGLPDLDRDVQRAMTNELARRSAYGK